MSDKQEDPALHRRMLKLGIREEDLEEAFVRGTGPGGQKINKTSSTVQLKHLPTGLEVRCQSGRNQSANRLTARTLLCDKLEEKLKAVHDARRQVIEKKKRQSRPRPRGLKENILKEKRQRSAVKKNRSAPRRGEE